MNSYTETKEIIGKVEELVRKYDITDEDFKQDLFLALLQQRHAKKEKEEEFSPDKLLCKLISEQIEKEESEDEYERVDVDSLNDDDEPKETKNEEVNSCCRIDLDNIMYQQLTPLEVKIIDEYFGIHSNSPHSIKEISIYNSCDANKVLSEALSKLRNPKNSFLKEYIFMF